mmetsp:Transcript_14453/g.30340  ORF Transcript_14453/g.30340 Transcript_14453/m.30340 type:complete len:206 (-) Transcript_14453:371-988(-)
MHPGSQCCGDDRHQKGRRLAAPGLRTHHDVGAAERSGEAVLLHRRGVFVTAFRDAGAEQLGQLELLASLLESGHRGLVALAAGAIHWDVVVLREVDPLLHVGSLEELTLLAAPELFAAGREARLAQPLLVAKELGSLPAALRLAHLILASAAAAAEATATPVATAAAVATATATATIASTVVTTAAATTIAAPAASVGAEASQGA